jgi:hypothetical protein
MMSTSTVTWLDSIDRKCLEMLPARIGGIPAGLGTPDKYILLSQDDQPVLRVDAYRSSEECFPFRDAVIWHDSLVIGWGNCAYLINVNSGAVTKHSLGIYFGHIYAEETYLLIASGERLCRIRPDGSLHWTSDPLGVDGVLVHDVSDGVISGDGEWDPPGGWRPFRLSLDDGQHAK